MPQSIPPGLKQEHILRAFSDLAGGIDHPFGQPTGYELVHDGKRFAPKAVVGLAMIVSAAYADPSGKEEKHVVVDLKAGKRFATPVTLAQFKADKAFAGWDLLRIGRLSVVPVPDAMWDRVIELAG